MNLAKGEPESQETRDEKLTANMGDLSGIDFPDRGGKRLAFV